MNHLTEFKNFLDKTIKQSQADEFEISLILQREPEQTFMLNEKLMIATTTLKASSICLGRYNSQYETLDLNKEYDYLIAEIIDYCRSPNEQSHLFTKYMIKARCEIALELKRILQK